MREGLSVDQGRDFLRRGFSRRDFGRLAALLATGAGGVASFEAAQAQGLSARVDIPRDAVRINANENPMGPCPEAVEAIREVVVRGGRYLYDETFAFARAAAEMEGLPRDCVAAFAGSSDPLHRAVFAFCGPARGLVVADPGYEAPERAARVLGAKTTKVPLRADGSHDVRAMAAADPQAGLIYLCNPNNPTGSITRPEDVKLLVASKPKDAIVLVDEAYIHFSKNAATAVPMILQNKDVVVLRTFSKLFGMAGLRAGSAMGRFDLIERLREYGAGALPVTGMVGAIASLKVADRLVPERRAIVTDLREDLVAWLSSRGCSAFPSEANMLMIDVGCPGREFSSALLKNKVAVGRTWPSHPNHIRITIGTAEEMAKFRAAFDRVRQA